MGIDKDVPHEKPLPPFQIEVSLWDMAVAWYQGYRDNAASAAFLANLDEQGEKTFGTDAWRRDNFVGYVYPKTSVAGAKGLTRILFDKPCNTKAIDSAPKTDSGGGGNGIADGGGSGHWGTDNPWQDCISGTRTGQACTSVDGGPKSCMEVERVPRHGLNGSAPSP